MAWPSGWKTEVAFGEINLAVTFGNFSAYGLAEQLSTIIRIFLSCCFTILLIIFGHSVNISQAIRANLLTIQIKGKLFILRTS
jgi:hypothetical protein